MKRFKTRVLFAIIISILISASANVFGQFSISYSPSSETLTQNTAMTSLTPTVTNGPVAALSLGAGVGLSGGTTLDSPYGVAVDASGNVYVANYGVDGKDLGSISKYNATTHTWSTFATDSISNPQGIAIDNSGNIYVLNYNRTNNGNGNYHGNAYVTEYNSSGTLMATVVQGLGTANGIAFNSSDGNIDIAEGSYNGGNTVISEYTSSGALSFSLSNSNISNPVNVATDGSGNIYVLNNTPNQVVKFSSSGAYIATLVNTGLTNPYGIYVDGSGNIYVSDSSGGTNSIKVYNASGTLLTSVTGLTNPQGLATDSKGNLYVTDYTNQTLTEYPATGGYYISGKLPPGLSFNYTNGTISGTPTTAFASTTYTITAYSASGSSSKTVTLVCNANSLAPTISYAPSVEVFTINTQDTLKATITNNPNSFSSSPALPTGVTFDALGNILVNNVTTVSAATIYTITAKNTASGLTGTTTVSIAFVKDNYWTGKQNFEWTNKQNWSAKVVPTSTTLASIGVVNYTGPDPIITTTDGAVSVGYLTLGAANPATVTAQSGAALTVNTTFQVNDNATPVLAGVGAFNVAPTGNVSIIGTGNLTINSGTTFVLQSSAAATASVAAITTGIINGQVTVQRYMSAFRGYRLMSSPVYAGNDGTNNYYGVNYLLTNTYLTGTGGTAGGFNKAGNPTLYLNRENLVPQYTTFLNSNFIGIANITNPASYGMNDSTYPTANIPVGNGYLFYYRGSSKQKTLAQLTVAGAAATTDTLNAVGILNQGSITVHDWYTPSSANLGYTTVSGSVNIEGSNLIGNPYASSINWDQYSATTATAGIYAPNVAPFSYQLILSGQGSGNYTVYEAGSVSKTGTAGNANANIIASGQGFFVFATTLNASLTFTENAKTLSQNTGTNLYLSKRLAVAVVSNQYLRLQFAMDSINTDGIIIRFNDNAKASFNFMEDARYRAGTGKVSLSSLSSDNIPLAINQLPLALKGDTIKLKIGVSATGTYTLNVAELAGIPQLYAIWLKDSFTKDSVNLRNTATYSFTVNTADTTTFGANRFQLILVQNPAYAYKLLSFNADKTGQGRQVQLTWTTANEQNYTNFTVIRSTDNGKTYDVIGSMNSNGAGSYSLLDQAPAIGHNYYLLKQTDINNTITYSNIADVIFQDNGNDKPGQLSLYPNPAVNTINLTILPKSQGNNTYNIKVSNSSGMVVKFASVTDTKWQDNVSSLLTGTYLIEVTDKNGSVVGQTKFVKL